MVSWPKTLARKLVDLCAAGLVTLGAPFFRMVGRWPANFPLFLRAADRAGVQWRTTHYYHPTYANSDLPDDVSGERDLPGVDLRPAEQLALLDRFTVQAELAQFAGDIASGPLAYTYHNEQYGPVDADALYAMIRHVKPARLFEIGSGHSTRMAKAALDKNRAEDAAYQCQHLCIEPYEMPWLEGLGVEVLRERVERLDLALFGALEAGDILFIDSSHVIRPFGDVVTEFQSIIPCLKPGVIVHIHDIFTPRDYPESWLREERRLWNEQYLLEVLLANNPRYEVVLALNWIRHNHADKLAEAFPIFAQLPATEPGAFWLRIAE